MKKTVLIAASLAQESLLLLRAQPQLELIQWDRPLKEFPELEKISGLIVRSQHQMDATFFQKTKKLQVLVTATVGFDHIDLEAAEKWGVVVMHTPRAHTESAAQLTWSLILAATWKLSAIQSSLKSGKWERSRFQSFELAGKTLGIIGLGRIGQRVAQIANAFQMSLLAYDPYVEPEAFARSQATRASFEELLKQSDVLSFHVPKTKETKYMLNRSHFEYIQRGVVIVNTSRGAVIQEADLIEAMEKGWVASAGLDVFETEPLQKNSRLLSLENIVLTPHLGSQTREAFERASDMAAEKIIRFFLDGSTADTLPPKDTWFRSGFAGFLS